MHEHELWFTALLNRYLAAPVNALYRLVGYHTEDPTRPWSNYIAMEVLVILVMMAAALLLRARLSVERPGKFQLVIEGVYNFLAAQAQDIIGHGYRKRLPWFAMIFLFILTSNLLGIIPSFESPTMYYFVPAGAAIAMFFYYNGQGIQEQGLLGHLKHFAGPVLLIAWFMFPLEVISHLIRPVSLTIRLYANMLAGEQVTLGFLALIPWVVPVVFMALHVFVSFIQAFIFTMLGMVYVGEAVAHEGH